MRSAVVWAVAFAAITWVACDRPEPAPAPPSKAPTQVLKQFEINDVQASTRTMTLESIEGRIYEQEKYADVDQPHVSFYKGGQVTSRLVAPAGRVYMDTHAVDAWGGVTVVSSDSSTLTADRMHYDPERKKITSQDPVRMEKPDSVTEGTGLDADPDLKSVKIGHQKVTMKQGFHP